MLRSPYVWAGVVLFSLVYFALTRSGSLVLTVMAAAMSGVCAVLFLQLALAAQDEITPRGAASCLAAVSIVLGVVLKALTEGVVSPVADAAAVPIAALSAWGFEALRGWSYSAPCFSCKAPLVTGQSATCPRCGQAVCLRPNCWSARHLRCSSCLKLEVVLFPSREDWWRQQFGDRVRQGVCDTCHREAHEADLRACGQCPQLLCRRCWDHHNGCCTRCGWFIQGLPRGLWPYMTANTRGHRSRRSSRSNDADPRHGHPRDHRRSGTGGRR